MLFEKPEQISRFVRYMSKRHKKIKFSFKTEKDNSFSFLDVKTCREKGKFTRSVFRKDKFSGVCTNISNFVALPDKFDLVYKFLHKIFSFPNFILKVKHLTKHFTNMLIPQNLLTNV